MNRRRVLWIVTSALAAACLVLAFRFDLPIIAALLAAGMVGCCSWLLLELRWKAIRVESLSRSQVEVLKPLEAQLQGLSNRYSQHVKRTESHEQEFAAHNRALTSLLESSVEDTKKALSELALSATAQENFLVALASSADMQEKSVETLAEYSRGNAAKLRGLRTTLEELERQQAVYTDFAESVRKGSQDAANILRMTRAELKVLITSLTGTASQGVSSEMMKLADGVPSNVSSGAQGGSSIKGTVIANAADPEARSDALRSEMRRLIRMSVEARQITMREVEALTQLYAELNPATFMPISGGWALSPLGIYTCVDLIRRNKFNSVLEIGSGVSTIWIAYALSKFCGGHVLALEHDAKFADKTTAALREHGLSDFATVLHTPLVEQRVGDMKFHWYDLSSRPKSNPVQLLLVDGPPESTGPLARYPALPLLHRELADDGWIVLDDFRRDDEQESVQRWLNEYPELSSEVSLSRDQSVMRFKRQADG